MPTGRVNFPLLYILVGSEPGDYAKWEGRRGGGWEGRGGGGWEGRVGGGRVGGARTGGGPDEHRNTVTDFKVSKRLRDLGVWGAQ